MASDEVLTRGDEAGGNFLNEGVANALIQVCLLYTSDAADE